MLEIIDTDKKSVSIQDRLVKLMANIHGFKGKGKEVETRQKTEEYPTLRC